jgi:3-hydroxy-9,10-secoandrosta-1,3,5(10)-triene-9,17-dione monooxygenase
VHDSIRFVHDAADELRAEHRRSDSAGRLTDHAARILRDSGGMRLLQAVDDGGFEAHPTEFLAWVRAVAEYNPSAGWVAGVVGVHPWEIALVDPRLRAEIFGDDPDTWVASPYAPNGRAVPVEGGFRFSGEWSYSTGTDHCDWVVLGGIVTGADGRTSGPPDVRHFFLPRGEYEIVEDSWHVMGLSGTGSKNIRIRDAFVPEYRTVGHTALCDGAYGDRQAGHPLYQMSFACMFSAAIASGTLGIAAGAVAAYREYLRTRVSASGVVGRTDPFQQEALAEVEADLAAAVVHLDVMVSRMYDEAVGRGGVGGVPRPVRLEFRRNQVRAVQRVLTSVDKLMARAGSSAVWTTWPLEQFWRDLRTGGTHLCNTTETIYTAWANASFATGGPVATFH